MNDNDLIRRGDAIAALNSVALTYGATWEPHSVRLCKDALREIPAAQPSPDVAALVEAVDHLLHNYLLDEHDEPDLCVDDNHWSAIHDAFTALARVKGGAE